MPTNWPCEAQRQGVSWVMGSGPTKGTRVLSALHTLLHSNTEGIKHRAGCCHRAIKAEPFKSIVSSAAMPGRGTLKTLLTAGAARVGLVHHKTSFLT
eukprot:365077-Chlamydomonas_euryale.AAC.11